MKMAKGSALFLNYPQSFWGVNRVGNLRAHLYKGDAFWSVTQEMADYSWKMKSGQEQITADIFLYHRSIFFQYWLGIQSFQNQYMLPEKVKKSQPEMH